jgi:hypothetical protein
MQTNLSRWIFIDANEPSIMGLHFNGYVWEYVFVPSELYYAGPSDCIVIEWFHPSEGWE